MHSATELYPQSDMIAPYFNTALLFFCVLFLFFYLFFFNIERVEYMIVECILMCMHGVYLILIRIILFYS